MSVRFQELDWRSTPMGELILRRRRDPVVGKEIYEIKLDDDFLMSSMFTVAEEEMARLALAELGAGPLDVLVGGLGLGYTALTVLASRAVHSLVVVEALDEVIEWHQRGLIPAGETLTADPRCALVPGDFFGMLRSHAGFYPANPGRRFHAVVVDIDHSPRHLLHPSHAGFYETTELARVGEHLHPGGVFALWSNDPPDDEFVNALEQHFERASAEVVRFHNPLQQRSAANTVYMARSADR